MCSTVLMHRFALSKYLQKPETRNTSLSLIFRKKYCSIALFTTRYQLHNNNNARRVKSHEATEAPPAEWIWNACYDQFRTWGASLSANIWQGRGIANQPVLVSKNQNDCLIVWYQNIRSPSFSFVTIVTIHASDGQTAVWFSLTKTKTKMVKNEKITNSLTKTKTKTKKWWKLKRN